MNKDEARAKIKEMLIKANTMIQLSNMAFNTPSTPERDAAKAIIIVFTQLVKKLDGGSEPSSEDVAIFAALSATIIAKMEAGQQMKEAELMTLCLLERLGGKVTFTRAEMDKMETRNVILDAAQTEETFTMYLTDGPARAEA